MTNISVPVVPPGNLCACDLLPKPQLLAPCVPSLSACSILYITPALLFQLKYGSLSVDNHSQVENTISRHLTCRFWASYFLLG